MSDKLRFVIVDDNLASATTAKVLLEEAGYSASIIDDPAAALETIPNDPPDGVLLDILMPGIDGLEVCNRLRNTPGLESLTIIMCSSKSFEFDKRRAAELGADGYIVKPIKKEQFLATVAKLVRSDIEMTFWGTRGTLPRPGRDSVRYGGNTSCMALEFPRGELFIFDAGSGIKMLADHLMKRGKRLEGKIFISHPHWDHINTLPFFTPLYVPGNAFEILGASHGPTKVKDLVEDQMDGVYFPITTREFGAKIEFTDLQQGSYEFGDVSIDTMLLAHPGNCLGYRITYEGRSISYITDNELFLETSDYYNQEYEEQLLDFTTGSDALIMDTNYFDDEYAARVGWGHSSVSQVAEFAHRAKAKTLYLFHHDHTHDDELIDQKIGKARELLRSLGSSTVCEAPVEQELIRI